jgi:hypothetical protein
VSDVLDDAARPQQAYLDLQREERAMYVVACQVSSSKLNVAATRAHQNLVPMQ